MFFWMENRFFDWKIDFSIKKARKKQNEKTKIGVGGRREAPSISFELNVQRHRFIHRDLAICPKSPFCFRSFIHSMSFEPFCKLLTPAEGMVD